VGSDRPAIEFQRSATFEPNVYVLDGDHPDNVCALIVPEEELSEAAARELGSALTAIVEQTDPDLLYWVLGALREQLPRRRLRLAS
jgi:hypothetical protein